MNPQSITLVAGQTATLTYTVAQTGLLRLVVTGLNGTLAGDFHVVGVGYDQHHPCPALGDLTLELLPGDYTVTFTPPAGYQLA